MENKIKEYLKSIGLNKREIEVYLVLVKRGNVSVGEISKEVYISRTHIYDALNSLLKKGLISELIKNNKKIFCLVNPEAILNIIEKEKIEISKKERIANESIELLNSLMKESAEESTIKIYEGICGAKEVLRDIIKENPKEVFSLSSYKAIRYTPEIIREWEKERVEKGIKCKVLLEKIPKNYEVLKRLKKIPLTEAKMVKLRVKTPFYFHVYNDKLCMVLGESRMKYILIKNKETSKNFMEVLNCLWKLEKNEV